jgi:hypothetical protein
MVCGSVPHYEAPQGRSRLQGERNIEIIIGDAAWKRVVYKYCIMLESRWGALSLASIKTQDVRAKGIIRACVAIEPPKRSGIFSFTPSIISNENFYY